MRCLELPAGHGAPQRWGQWDILEGQGQWDILEGWGQWDIPEGQGQSGLSWI